MSFANNIKNLKRLFRDSEKQLKEFNDIVPYEHNPNNIYSPILVNLLLQIGPQIESLTDIIIEKISLDPKTNGGIPSRIQIINQNGVLSNFRIISRFDGSQFTPFPLKAEWWAMYNKTKHDLHESQFKMTYLAVMNTLAALASLHRLADAINGAQEEYLDNILNKQYWNETFDYQLDGNTVANRIIPPSWKSEIFRIENYFVYASSY